MSAATPSPYRTLDAGVWGPWRKLAACRDVDPGVFFPLSPTDDAAAKAVCGGCPVRVECLEAHLREPHGVFGGLNEVERRGLARRRRRAS